MSQNMKLKGNSVSHQRLQQHNITQKKSNSHLLTCNIDISPYPGFLIRYADGDIEVTAKWEFTGAVSYTPVGSVTSYFPPNYCTADAATYNNLTTTKISETIEETFKKIQ